MILPPFDENVFGSYPIQCKNVLILPLRRTYFWKLSHSVKKCFDFNPFDCFFWGGEEGFYPIQ